jgi:hypothetical protein
MTRIDDFTHLLEDYLEEYEGSTPLPEDVRDAIRAELPSTSQRPTWWPARRLSEMNNMMKLGLATAGVVVAALLGYNYLVAPSVGGPPIDDPSPTPTPQSIHEGSLSPGTYMIDDPFPVRITFDVPDGWCSWISSSDVTGLVVDNRVEDCNSGWGPAFWIVRNVFADPCEITSQLDPQLGPSVDDLVAALASLPGYEATTPTEVTVSGFSGVEFELTAPEYGDECPDHRTWSTSSVSRTMLPGEMNRIQILDVDGVRLVLTIVEYAHTTEYEQSLGIPFDANAHTADQPDLRQMLDSMRIESQP